ncbi:flagellar basal-body MS-ring/collar protein FliF [Paracandidimonas soli]|uniref:Flagellar M-ring protein n=1 Tax=Paracandidimonas soli TaxID=1917182 RepID=A0A4R3VBC9_9BURK|nr:flagellar basal-body MS-ring/collar protein FliF [Paracandidimonas soli]TCV00829.1 flagellar M-ring protein FliF [Paracandidimonas soli]
MSEQAALLSRFPALAKARDLPRHYQIGALAALVALVVVLLLWSRGPDYRVLFSNLEDRDGGAIVSALSQMNIPYRFSENGGAILIPAEQVHATRLQLAEQGLPRSGQVGFELFDNARFGASQFSEQVTYQRGLEGELGSSIEALHSVQKARVHLAIPRETLFVRERQAPTASVLLNLYPGRHLNQNQVAAIAWLVSSSVPNLSAENVSIVDQNGRLLTQPSGEAKSDGLRRDMVHDVEQRTVERIMTLLTPLVGAGNARAQVSADIDFSQREQTSEVYRPNQNPGEAAIRSQQLSASSQAGPGIAQGVPGALSNQPPADPVAPVDAPAPADTVQAGPGATPAAATNRNTRSDSTTNYELDRTISHVKDPTGRIQRLSAAVVVNYREQADGTLAALSEEDLAKIESIVRQAMGFNADRGDTVSVVNSQFNDTPDTLPVWKDPEMHALAILALKYLLIAIALLFAWRKIAKPILDSLLTPRVAPPAAVDRNADALLEEKAQAERRASEISRYEDNLNTARQMAEKDPRAVAMVMRTWMEKNGNR